MINPDPPLEVLVKSLWQMRTAGEGGVRIESSQ